MDVNMESKKDKLEKVRQQILLDMDCPLKKTANNLVFGKGNPDAPILFIGEAPGEKEDLQGIPFVGAAGKQLDKLLHLIGLDLDSCYVANILKYRPPENRNPLPDEIRRHTPYLVEQIKIIKPAIIATLGNFSTKFVLAKFDCDKMDKIPGITSLHGVSKDLEIDGMHFTVVPLFHPAAVLYKPGWLISLKEDFYKMKEIIEKNNAKSSSLDFSIKKKN
jgi:uracil-DNA glycosylase